MNILVFGGSPKGEKSVTMQYVKWLQKNHPEHRFEVIQVAQPIARIEKDMGMMAEIREKVLAADGILWAFPLYVAMVHAGLKRFIELITECGMSDAFSGKHAAILATSIHFFDNTAIEYLRGVSEDLGMVVDEVFSAEMQYLTRPGGAKQLGLFFRKWTQAIEKGTVTGRRTAPIHSTQRAYIPGNSVPATPRPITVGIVTQSGGSENLDNMVSRISKEFAKAELFDLSSMQIAGGCTGCLRCGYENICLYEGKDDVIATYRRLQKCDAVLFCGFIVDRYFSARWKTFIDRMFFSTHTPVFPGMPMGFVVSGPLRQLPNFRDILEDVYGAMEVRLAGTVTDEDENIDGSLTVLADSLHFYASKAYTPPNQFLAIGGRKVFRDEIFGGLGGVFSADYKYYRKHGWYDFPHKQIGMRLASMLMRTAMKIPPVRKNLQDNMKDYMLMSYKKVL